MVDEESRLYSRLRYRCILSTLHTEHTRVERGIVIGFLEKIIRGLISSSFFLLLSLKFTNHVRSIHRHHHRPW